MLRCLDALGRGQALSKCFLTGISVRGPDDAHLDFIGGAEGFEAFFVIVEGGGRVFVDAGVEAYSRYRMNHVDGDVDVRVRLVEMFDNDKLMVFGL